MATFNRWDIFRKKAPFSDLAQDILDTSIESAPVAAGTGAGSAAAATTAPAKVLPVTVGGTTYYLALYDTNA